MPLTHPRLAEVLMFLRPGLRPPLDFQVQHSGDVQSLIDGTLANPPTQAELDAVTDAQVDAFVLDRATDDEIERISSGVGVILKALFNHENRIRTLAGQQQVTVAQFKAGLKALA